MAGPKIPILSFFSGAGFLDLGFAATGFDIIWRNENFPQFIYGFNYAMACMKHKYKIDNDHSIVDIGPKQILREAFNNTPASKFFGIIGGPPCPDFSVGGKNLGYENDRGKLSQVYVNRLIELQPTFFLFENVPGIIRTKKHREFIQRLIRQLAIHYVLDIKIVNALDYGVPQDRERFIMVGFNKRWAKKHDIIPDYIIKQQMAYLPFIMETGQSLFSSLTHWFPWTIGKKYENAKGIYNWPTTNPFGQKIRKPSDIPDELMVGPLICKVEETSRLPNGKEFFHPYSSKFKQIDEGDVSKKSFKRLHRWRYSPAAAYGNNEVHLHPTLPRRLTVREAMRIQTVPDNYSFPPEMPLSHKYKAIGNGVPVKLAKALAAMIHSVLKEGIHGNIRPNT